MKIKGVSASYVWSIVKTKQNKTWQLGVCGVQSGCSPYGCGVWLFLERHEQASTPPKYRNRTSPNDSI